MQNEPEDVRNQEPDEQLHQRKPRSRKSQKQEEAAEKVKKQKNKRNRIIQRSVEIHQDYIRIDVQGAESYIHDTFYHMCHCAGGSSGNRAYKVYPMYLEYKDTGGRIMEASTPDTFRLQEASFIYDANGEVLAKLTGDEDSSYLTYDEIPEYAVNAFIAIEGQNIFGTTPGIDIKGIFRVAINYFKTEGEEKHGASTITRHASEPVPDQGSVD